MRDITDLVKARLSLDERVYIAPKLDALVQRVPTGWETEGNRGRRLDAVLLPLATLFATGHQLPLASGEEAFYALVGLAIDDDADHYVRVDIEATPERIILSLADESPMRRSAVARYQWRPWSLRISEARRYAQSADQAVVDGRRDLATALWRLAASAAMDALSEMDKDDAIARGAAAALISGCSLRAGDGAQVAARAEALDQGTPPFFADMVRAHVAEAELSLHCSKCGAWLVADGAGDVRCEACEGG